MSDQSNSDGATALDSPLASTVEREANQAGTPGPGFIRRYRLPLTLAVIAACLYAGSILYILYGRGQIA